VLETPLYGRFVGENKKLVFGPTGPYVVLVRLCVIGGGLGVLVAALAPSVNLPDFPVWWWIATVGTCGAGILAAWSLELVVFDLKERVYRRRQGPGTFHRTTRGRLSDLDAVVLIAEPNSRLLNGGVTYHLLLHWKLQKEPAMVLQQDTRIVPPGQPLNAAAGPIYQRGAAYAKALGLPLYDNAHFPSANPVPMFR
jgi:hypothetical protein